MNQLMLALISHEIEGKLVHQRASDGYVNATAMCNAVGKLFADYRRLKATDEFLKELASDMGIPISQLVLSFKGNTTQYQQGTWVHPDVATGPAGRALRRGRVEAERGALRGGPARAEG